MFLRTVLLGLDSGQGTGASVKVHLTVQGGAREAFVAGSLGDP